MEEDGFEIISVTEAIIKTSSDIPTEITLELLGGFNKFGKSALIEEFLIKKLEANNLEFSDTEIYELKNKVRRLEKDARDLFSKIESKLDLSNLTLEVKKEVMQVAERLGANQEQILQIKNTEIELVKSLSYSSANQGKITINLLQITRKVLDILSINKVSEIDAFTTVFKHILAHELGHVVDFVLKNRSNQVTNLLQTFQENKEERFAEFIAETIVTIKHTQFNYNRFSIYEVYSLFQALQKYNSRNSKNVGIFQLFEKLEYKLEDSESLDILDFIGSRSFFYGNVYPEVYSMPYNWEDLKKEIK